MRFYLRGWEVSSIGDDSKYGFSVEGYCERALTANLRPRVTLTVALPQSKILPDLIKVRILEVIEPNIPEPTALGWISPGRLKKACVTIVHPLTQRLRSVRRSISHLYSNHLTTS